MSFSRTVDRRINMSVFPSTLLKLLATLIAVFFLLLNMSCFLSGVEGLMRTGSLHVADDRTGLVVHELDANLGDTTARA